MRTEFIEQYAIDNLVPADYNPRFLPEEKFNKLVESLKMFGVIKPLIVNGDNGVLTAGHQRTRAMKAAGIKKAPVIRIKGINIQDEIRFNLFHNSIETDKSKVNVNTEHLQAGEYAVIKPENISVSKNVNAAVVKAICGLITRYGEWGSVVCGENGDVILNNEYAVAAKLTHSDLLVYVIPNEQREKMIEYLSEDYGEYNYETLGIKSHNQLYCQMNRLGENSKRAMRSSLYENYVMQKINKDIRILDFGAGKCAYANLLRKQGYKIFAYEPNFQNRKSNIDIKAVVSMLSQIEKDVEQNGLYDMVILDSVFNSVVSDEVENYVAATCRCFLKQDGVFMTATRNLEQIQQKTERKFTRQKGRELEFLDKNNFSATFRSGVWTMQHFHTKETLKTLLLKYFDDVEVSGTKTGSQVYAIAKKPKEIDLKYAETALEFELNMEYPKGYKHNAHNNLKRLILEELKK